MLINSAGEQKELSCFERGDITDATYSCLINWKNHLFVFGGWYEKRQISRLSGYRLERIGTLDFDHQYGACSVMANQFVFLCFNLHSSDHKRCRRSTGPLKPFTEVTLAKHEHSNTQTSCSESKYFCRIGH